jgi:class 3 adenylate cyclase
MSNETVHRRLAAILAADVVGYSKLMGADEVGTLARLKSHRRELVDPMIAAHHGRIVKTTGDGALVEFGSVVDAVASAVAIQRGMAKRNVSLPEGERIVFRIGINVGDIIIDGDDIFGDGVNIAARLETLCEPGGVCISRAANDQIRDKLSLAFADMGEQTVKNISRTVGVFGLRSSDIEALPESNVELARSEVRVANEQAQLTLPSKPSIAVLPFANLTADPEQE